MSDLTVCVCKNLAKKLCDNRNHSVLLSEALVGHVPGCSLRADENVSADRLKRHVLHIRSDPAVRLTKHRLWPQRGCHQEHLLPFQSAGVRKKNKTTLRTKTFHRSHRRT